MILVVLAASLGIFAGYVVSLIAPEELKPGQNHLIIFQNIVFSLLPALTVSFFSGNIFVAIAIGIAIFALSYKKSIAKAFFPFTGIIIFFVQQDIMYLITIALLVFLLGGAYTAISAEKYAHDDKLKNRPYLFFASLKIWILFIIIGLLPFLISKL